jgi:hypothetical protein
LSVLLIDLFLIKAVQAIELSTKLYKQKSTKSKLPTVRAALPYGAGVQQVEILQKVFAKIRRLENYINLDYFGTNKSGIKKKRWIRRIHFWDEYLDEEFRKIKLKKKMCFSDFPESSAVARFTFKTGYGSKASENLRGFSPVCTLHDRFCFRSEKKWFLRIYGCRKEKSREDFRLLFFGSKTG